MNAAIAKAQETLPQFWQAFEKRENGDEDFALKVKIQDGENVEHFWVVDIERKDGKLLGTISNEPEFVGNVKMGQQISIPEADISDWVYTHDGKMVGNHTLRALFKHMPAGEVEKYRQMLADP